MRAMLLALLGVILPIAAGPTAAETEAAETEAAEAEAAETEATDDAPLEPIPFTFKKISPPQPGAKQRITVQIDPEEQARLLAAPFLPPLRPAPNAPLPSGDGAPLPPLALRDPAIAAFWEVVGRDLQAASPARLEAATRHLASSADLPVPRLADVQQIAALHGPTLLGHSIGTSVSPALALAVIMVESGGRVEVVSGAGAQGLMQLIPATAERFGVADAFDPRQNIAGGIAYLDWLLREFGGDALLALAGYNAGENAVKRAGGVPPYPETEAYVPKVVAAWSVARRLCRTPPELPSDGCVFTTMAVN